MSKTMAKNNFDNYATSEISDSSYHGKNILNKHEYDLFNEEENHVERVVRIKRIKLPNNGENWKIIENNKVMFVVQGSKLSKKEKEYLRTADGFNFLIHQYKEDIKSFNKLRIELKKKLKR